MITTAGLTKRYRDALAVDDLTITVPPGRVTGFLGPNGAGKSTTMRLILGLDRPTSGSVAIDGMAYRELRHPLRSVGALLDPSAVDPRRSAVDHLSWLAASNRIDRRRAGHVLDLVGLAGVAGRRVGTFSLGMRQRLGLAAALLGDPHTVVLDEPTNGLDPEGILWMRGFVRSLAAEGRTVFLSSHLMGEVAQTADHLLVIGAGRLLADGSTAEVLHAHGRAGVRIDAAEATAALIAVVERAGGHVRRDGGGAIATGLGAAEIGRLAAAQGIALVELSPVAASLEHAFLELTHDVARHRAVDLAAAPREVGELAAAGAQR